MNNAKKCSGTMNSSKNKLNSEIILIFNLNSNAHYMSTEELVQIWSSTFNFARHQDVGIHKIY